MLTEYKSRFVVLLVAVVASSVVLGAVATPVAAQDEQSVEIDVIVTEDGEIDAMEMVMTIDEQTYDELLSWAEMEGYDSVGEWMAADSEEEDEIVSASGEDVEIDDGYEIHLEITEIDESGDEDFNVTVEDDVVAFEMTNIEDPAEDPNIDEFIYNVVMPGDVEDSNADTVDGNVATWNLHEEPVDELSVTATLVDDADDADDAADDADDDIPGFGVAIALASLLAVAALALRVRN